MPTTTFRTATEPWGPLPGVCPADNRKLWRAGRRLLKAHPGGRLMVSVAPGVGGSVSVQTPNGGFHSRRVLGPGEVDRPGKRYR